VDASTVSDVLPSLIATLAGAGAAILGGWASAHFTARQARRRAAEARDERRRILASLLLDELANIEAALGSFPNVITRRRFRPLPETPVLDRMLSVADAFDAQTVTTLLGVREMVRAHRRVSRECHVLYRKYQRLPQNAQRGDAESGLLDVVGDATETTYGVLQTAVTALRAAGAVAGSDERAATRRFTYGAVEDTLRWTAVHPAASAAMMGGAAFASEHEAEPPSTE
jgi:hypothetical protein